MTAMFTELDTDIAYEPTAADFICRACQHGADWLDEDGHCEPCAEALLDFPHGKPYDPYFDGI